VATHQYTRESSGATVGAALDHTFTTSAFTVPVGERFVRMKVYMGPNSAQSLQMRGSAQSIFGSSGWDQWSSTTTGVWSSGSGASVKVHNSGSSALSKRLYAVFETEDLPTYGITCNTSGSGTLKSNLSKAYQGQTVTLTATPAAGYKFSKYTTSPAVTITNNKFSMPASTVTITAKFVNQSYAVTVVSEDATKGTVDGSGTYAYDSDVTIKAIPKPGYKFTNWTTTRGTISNPTSAETTFEVPAGAATITAHFERSQSVIDYFDGEEHHDCFASVMHNGQFVDCDAYEYTGSGWVLCSKGGD